MEHKPENINNARSEVPSGVKTNFERQRKVEQREGKLKFYHTSKNRYSPGDIIEGFSTNGSTPDPVVFLTNGPAPHYSIADREDIRDAYVYQVEPIGTIRGGRDWDEFFVPRVKVLRRIGNAAGFIERNEKSFVKFNRQPHRREVSTETALYLHSNSSSNAGNYEESKRRIEKAKKYSKEQQKNSDIKNKEGVKLLKKIMNRNK